MQRKLFTSVLNLTLSRVYRAAGRSRDEFLIDVDAENGIVRQLQVGVPGASRRYVVGSNTKWSHALLDDALDGAFNAATGSAPRLGPVVFDNVLSVGPQRRQVFFDEFETALSRLEDAGKVLSIAQGGALCRALQHARVLELADALELAQHALQVPSTRDVGDLAAPGLDIDFVRRRFAQFRAALMSA